jgi:hypothetical protein
MGWRKRHWNMNRTQWASDFSKLALIPFAPRPPFFAQRMSGCDLIGEIFCTNNRHVQQNNKITK